MNSNNFLIFLIIGMSVILIKYIFLKLEIREKFYLYQSNKLLRILYLSLVAVFSFLIPLTIDQYIQFMVFLRY